MKKPIVVSVVLVSTSMFISLFAADTKIDKVASSITKTSGESVVALGKENITTDLGKDKAYPGLSDEEREKLKLFESQRLGQQPINRPLKVGIQSPLIKNDGAHPESREQISPKASLIPDIQFSRELQSVEKSASGLTPHEKDKLNSVKSGNEVGYEAKAKIICTDEGKGKPYPGLSEIEKKKLENR